MLIVLLFFCSIYFFFDSQSLERKTIELNSKKGLDFSTLIKDNISNIILYITFTFFSFYTVLLSAIIIQYFIQDIRAQMAFVFDRYQKKNVTVLIK